MNLVIKQISEVKFSQIDKLIFDCPLITKVDSYYELIVNEKLAGACALYYFNDVGELASIGLVNDFRKKGLGGFFMMWILGWFVGKGCKIVELEYENEKYIQFYKQFGFGEIGNYRMRLKLGE